MTTAVLRIAEANAGRGEGIKAPGPGVSSNR